MLSFCYRTKPHCGRRCFMWRTYIHLSLETPLFYELWPSNVVDWEVFRLGPYCESLQCKAMFSGHGLWKRLFLLQGLYVSLRQCDPQSITAHIITALYGHVPLKPQPGPPFWVFHHFRSLRFRKITCLKRPDTISIHGVSVSVFVYSAL